MNILCFWRSKRAMKFAGALLALLLLVVFCLSAYIGWALTHPHRKALRELPSEAGLTYENISFFSRQDSLKMSGWLLPAKENKGTIIFAHGYRQNRLQDDVPGLSLGQALVAQGYNVVLFDFRNSGESAGSLTSVGELEVRDLLGAVDFVKSRQDLNQSITLFGFSMGAATAIVAGSEESAVKAVIADSPFADLRSYLADHLTVWTHLPSFPFNETVLTMIPLMTGIDARGMSPLKDVAKLAGRPLLLLHGNSDITIPVTESQKLQQAYPQAKLVIIPGAKHVQGFHKAKELYLEQVLAFLQ
ncbi:MAG: alpha/beta fold hydrolase [Sporomusaceae bacterium]|nr:alpha/beta fold hydrolase [Sporomusaceae bacterium]